MTDYEGEVISTSETATTKYESSERLMSKEDAQDLSTILEISLDQFNNFLPLAPPIGAGAGRVKKFQDHEKVPFLTRPSDMDLEEDERDNETVRGESSILEFVREAATLSNMGRIAEREADIAEAENWPQIPKLANDEYEPTPEEVKRRASWAWYRTSLLCTKARQDISAKSRVNARYEEGSGDENAICMLTKRADKAKAYALSLFPQLIETEDPENSVSASWGEGFTDDDVAYYMEMSLNHEYNQRVTAALHYKIAAFQYIREALLLYLEWKQESELSASGTHADPESSGRLKFWTLEDLQASVGVKEERVQEKEKEKGMNLESYAQTQMFQHEFGSMSQLWSDAAEWASLRLDIWKSEHFRRYWRRAALARGHAEWLLREREYDNPTDQPKAIENWRLAPPATIGQYDNDCVIVSLIMAACPKSLDELKRTPFPFYDDDEYGTLYNTVHTAARDTQAEAFGWPKHAFFFGPPDFITSQIASNGLMPYHIGLIPNDQTSTGLSAPVAVYERYRRKGIQDFLPPTATPYDRDLAICADDILAEANFYRILSHTLHPSYETLSMSLLKSLKTSLEKIFQRRAHMTLRTATDHGFDAVVYKIVKKHMDKVQQNLLRRPPGPQEHEFLLFLEHEIQYLLAAWFQFSLLETTGGRIVIHLRSLITHNIYGEHTDPYIMSFYTIAEPVAQCLENTRLLLLDEYLEHIRTAILTIGHLQHSSNANRDNLLSPAVYVFLVPVFQAYLESGGDPEKMPLVRTGNRKKRDLTKLGLFRAVDRMKCREDCKCPRPEAVKVMEGLVGGRVSESDAQARLDRRVICDFFEEAERNKGVRERKVKDSRKARIELFERIRRR